jgi:hypothetical protein
MVVFGGGLGFTSPCSNETWVLKNANSVSGTPAWTELFPTGGAPPARLFHTAVYDPGSNRMIVFGGNNCFSGLISDDFNDVWVLTNANGLGGAPAWTQLTPAGTAPSRRAYQGAVYDAASNRMTVFGGFDAAGVFYNDVWVLSNANGLGGAPTWTQLTPSGTPPSPRASFATAGVPLSNRMVVLAGGTATNDVNQTWVLSNANGLGTPSWTQLSPSGTLPSARDSSTAVYDQSLNQAVIFGGELYGTTTRPSYNDTWALTLTTNITTPGIPVAEGVGATWIQVSSPFSGDDNGDSYTTYEYATASGGPWTMACANGIPGDPDWRRCAIYDLTPATQYYVRVTFYDPDGVAGANSQIIGPITTKAVSNNFVTIGQATARVEDTNILVSIPAADDANANSTGTVSIATSPNGPWTQRCGTMANAGPKQCRVHGLTNGTNYYLQVSISDPDGVYGITPQVIGPVHYTGLTDLALAKPVTADPGWGCCTDPNQLTDGVIEATDWAHGFAWTGGTGDWGGGLPGIKKATVDLQTAQTVGRVDWWIQNTESVPGKWNVSVSIDGSNFTQVFANTEVTCRTATEYLDISWYYPSCKLSATFPPVSARYVRTSFDDTTLFDGMHEWAVELEVFAWPGSAATPPALSVACPAAVFDGNPHSCAGSATGSGGVAVGGSWSFSPASEVNAGSYAVTGTFTSSDLSYTGGEATGTLVISQATQTINFPNPGTQTWSLTPITLTATASSGLPVSYTVVSGPATISSNKLTITGTGALTVRASQAGNSNYLAASPASVTFTVNLGCQFTLASTVTSPATVKTAADMPLTAFYGDTVTISACTAPNPAAKLTYSLLGTGLKSTLASGVVSFKAAEQVAVTITAPAGAGYGPVSWTSATATVAKRPLSVQANSTNWTYGQSAVNPIQLAVAAGSPPLVFSDALPTGITDYTITNAANQDVTATAPNQLPIGSYTITPSAAKIQANNVLPYYVITPVTGKLVVAPNTATGSQAAVKPGTTSISLSGIEAGTNGVVSVLVTNESGETLNINASLPGGTPYAVSADPACAATSGLLPNGGKCKLTVTFQPTVAGVASPAKLSITAVDANNDQFNNPAQYPFTVAPVTLSLTSVP